MIKVVAITGASSGIGEAVALHLSAQGAKVVLAARGEEKLNALADRFTDAGGAAVAVSMDVSRRDDLVKVVDAESGALRPLIPERPRPGISK